MLLLESCLQTCMTYTIAELQWINCWWWAEELSETCRVSSQNKFWKLLHLFGFIIRKFVTMHGLMNVKKKKRNCGSIHDCIKIFYLPQKRSDLLGCPHNLPSADARGVERQSREVYYSPPYLFEVKNAWSYIAIFPYEEQPRRTC